ncbi:hypothetical protein GW17_00002493, partial [Ensete ventricosum]
PICSLPSINAVPLDVVSTECSEKSTEIWQQQRIDDTAMSRIPSASPSFFLQRIRLPAISSLTVSASRPASYFRSSSSQPQLSFSPRLRHPPVSPPPTSSFLRWTAPPMVGTPRLRTKVCYCAGGSGRDNKELLVQHLLVGEDNLKLLLELQQRISGGHLPF